MECKDYKEYLQDYVDGILDAEEMDLIDRHAAQCDDCYEEIEFLKNYSTIMSSLPNVEAPDDFLQQLHVKIDDSKTFNGKMKRIIAPVKRNITIEAAGLLATAAILFIVFKPALKIEQTQKTDFPSISDTVDKKNHANVLNKNKVNPGKLKKSSEKLLGSKSDRKVASKVENKVDVIVKSSRSMDSLVLDRSSKKRVEEKKKMSKRSLSTIRAKEEVEGDREYIVAVFPKTPQKNKDLRIKSNENFAGGSVAKKKSKSPSTKQVSFDSLVKKYKGTIDSRKKLSGVTEIKASIPSNNYNLFIMDLKKLGKTSAETLKSSISKSGKMIKVKVLLYIR